MIYDKVITTSDNFCVATIKQPHIDRKDGGHIVIASINPQYKSLSDIPNELAKELIVLAKYCAKAMIDALKCKGIDIELVNFQINGNWSFDLPNRDVFHMHIYGRARSSKKQKFGQALYFPACNSGFYDDLENLTNEDIMAIRNELKKYSNNLRF